MTQEHEELLLRDLCSRLPYGVKLEIEDINEVKSVGTLYRLDKQSFWVLEDEYERSVAYNKQYLFPLSSMTEEQKEEYQDLLDNQYSFDANENIFTLQDFYCKYHFDYRGLIPLGLAIDATNLNVY